MNIEEDICCHNPLKTSLRTDRKKECVLCLLLLHTYIFLQDMFRFLALLVALATVVEAFRIGMPTAASRTSTSALSMMAGADDYPSPRPEFNEFDAFQADSPVLAKVCI